MESTADILKSYCQANDIKPSSNPKSPLFYNRDHKKLTVKCKSKCNAKQKSVAITSAQSI